MLPGYNRIVQSYELELAAAMKAARKVTAKHKLQIMLYVEIVYVIWLQRANFVFNQ